MCRNSPLPRGSLPESNRNSPFKGGNPDRVSPNSRGSRRRHTASRIGSESDRTHRQRQDTQLGSRLFGSTEEEVARGPRGLHPLDGRKQVSSDAGEHTSNSALGRLDRISYDRTTRLWAFSEAADSLYPSQNLPRQARGICIGSRCNSAHASNWHRACRWSMEHCS